MAFRGAVARVFGCGNRGLPDAEVGVSVTASAGSGLRAVALPVDGAGTPNAGFLDAVATEQGAEDRAGWLRD